MSHSIFISPLTPQIDRGSLVYEFDCGSGQGRVHIPVALSDGQWHTIQLDRNGREAELALDGVYTALGVAPGIHAILNVDTEEVYFGAVVDVFPNGYRDIKHGFEVNICIHQLGLIVKHISV